MEARPTTLMGLIMDNIKHNGYVKWPAFLSAILILVALILAIPAFSVSYGEFQQFEKRFEDKFASVDKGIAEIKQLLNRN